ncbi:hypothetical protein [Mycoplasmopsis verecunda]|uniref:Uncharacterized protein n=1 Tax=Mycoplasmopsis verecunda TaxID=171291 RepID=A0A1T4L0Y2_9BACT|nr:hypothetical protein [Mycoplasmopsis verecunda]WPB54393.1 hypothetical protein SAM46_02800 [Mycoplasmopsis verecunda]SJZ48384.1 hypothetical protein SAMN02745154_00282 [Mycoplasmopsis verecunda]
MKSAKPINVKQSQILSGDQIIAGYFIGQVALFFTALLTYWTIFAFLLKNKNSFIIALLPFLFVQDIKLSSLDKKQITSWNIVISIVMILCLTVYIADFVFMVFENNLYFIPLLTISIVYFIYSLICYIIYYVHINKIVKVN